MNFEQTVAALGTFFGKWHVTLLCCGVAIGMWLHLLSPYLQPSSASASLLALASHCEVWVLLVTVTQGLEGTFLVCCTLATNAVLHSTMGPATLQEYTAVMKRLATENSFLQLVIIALGQEHLSAMELLLWSCVFTFYTSCRGLLCFAESRFQSGRRNGLDTALWVLLSTLAVFLVLASWCFWEAGAMLLLQMHYDGAQLLLQTAGLMLTAKWNSIHSTSAEIRITAAAHAVAFVQWSHFLLAYMKWLGFPIQFFLFYKLTKTIQLLQQDVLRYRGFHTSTGLFLQQCPPLPAAELEALGSERCCMCWEALRDSSCSRLPCGHVHHV